MSLRLSQNQEEFGGAGLKCPPEHWAAREAAPPEHSSYMVFCFLRKMFIKNNGLGISFVSFQWELSILVLEEFFKAAEKIFIKSLPFGG
jgi:hypothetical protein